MKEIDDDLIYESSSTNACLRKFVDNDEKFSKMNAIELINEMRRMWLEIEKLIVKIIDQLKQNLMSDHIFLEYHLLREFLTEGVERMRKIREKDEVDKLCKDIIVCVKRILDNSKSRFTIDKKLEEVLLIVVIIKIKEMIKADQRFDSNMLSMF